MDCEYEIALPREKFSSSMSSLVNMTRDSLLMMLTAFNDSKSNKVVSEDSVTFDCSAIFPEAKEIFKTLAAEEKYIQVFSGMKNFLKDWA